MVETDGAMIKLDGVTKNLLRRRNGDACLV